MHALSRRLAADAADWGLATWFAHTLFWLPVIGTPVVLAEQLARPVTQEQLVWWQFLGFALAGVAGLGVALRSLERGQIEAVLLWTLITIALCIIAGEQVLWGQRISDLYATPELRAIHRYQELSQPHHPITAWMCLGIGILGVGTPLVDLRRAAIAAGQPARARLPLFLAPTFCAAGTIALATLLGWLDGSSPISAATWPMLYLAWALWVGVAACYRRLTETARQLYTPISSTI